MQGLHTAERVTGADADTIAGNSSGIMFNKIDHISGPRGYMPSASPPSQPPLKCPRCDSTNTKFCYYNNYNLSQPRHFCKACRRYWTKGGVLRNVPVGGGCRKSKRVSGPSPKSSKSTSNKTCKRTTAASGTTSDTSTITSVEPLNNDSGLIFADTHRAELPSRLIAPGIGDQEFSVPEPTNSHIMTESKELYKTKADDDSVLPAVPDQTGDADILPPFQAQLGSDGVLAFPGLDWSLPVDQSMFDLSSGALDTASIWNQNNWCDTVADPALYLP